MTRFGRLRRFLLLTPTSLAIAAVVLALADWGSWMAGDSFFPGGPLDEFAHLLTTVLVLWALGRSACRRFLVPAAIASVAIDLDHVPGQLGAQFLTEGTPRPYTHSLLTIAVMLVAALLLRRRRDVFLAIALGLAVHFFRDLSEPRSGVALLWPWSDHSFSLPHGTYVGAIAAVVMFDAGAALLKGPAGANLNGINAPQIGGPYARTGRFSTESRQWNPGGVAASERRSALSWASTASLRRREQGRDAVRSPGSPPNPSVPGVERH